jgi:hypothetical protein
VPDKDETGQRPRYSVVVPVYNSDRSVEELVERLENVFDRVLKATYEVILVDDGSASVTTWPTLRRLAEERPWVSSIRLMRNYGKASAILCGLTHMRGKWVVTIDDDLQQRPEDIPELIKYEDHDVVVGNFTTRRHDRFTVVTSRIKSCFDDLILGLPCKMSPLKLFKAEVAEGMLQIQTNRPFIPALMAHVTRDFVPVHVDHCSSRHGESRYSVFRRFQQFLNLLIGNSSFLLRVFGAIGFAVALVGFGSAIYVVARKILGYSILPGWASLVVINLVFGGFVLMGLSIIGEYLIRILEGSSRKPPYVIREMVGLDKAHEGGAHSP